MADYQLTQTGAEVQAILDAVDDIQTDVGELQSDITSLQTAVGGKSAITYYTSRVVSVANDAEILRITNSSITADTVVLGCVFDDPSYISGDVTWTSYAGYISFIGTCTVATTADVTLGTKIN